MVIYTWAQVASLTNTERWKRKIIDAEYVSEIVITITIKWHQRRIELTSVYFLSQGTRTCTSQKLQKHRDPLQKTTIIVSLDLEKTVNVTTLESMQRENLIKVAFGMKQWLMIQNSVALNTTFKNSGKRYTFRPTSGKGKQLHFVLIDKSSRRYCTDAEANDIIHLGSDHRSVVAHFDSHCVQEKGGSE